MGLSSPPLFSSDRETNVQRDYVFCLKSPGQNAAVRRFETRACGLRTHALNHPASGLFMENVNMQIQGADAQCLSPGESPFPEYLAPPDQVV